jgi:hypothetical protein
MTSEALTLIGLTVLTWIVTGSVTYGVMKVKISDFERRLSDIEADHKQLERDFVNHRISAARGYDGN